MKLKCTALIILIAIINLKSQINFSLSTGGNYSSVIIAEYTDFEKIENQEMTFIPNFNGGIYAEYHLKKTTLSSGFFLSRRGTKLGEKSFWGSSFLGLKSLQFYFWEIPLLVQYQFKGKRFEIGGGIINSILDNADISRLQDPEYQLDFKGLVRYNITPRLSSEFGYTFGGIHQSGDLTYYRHSVFNLNVNYRFLSFDFNKKKK